MFKDNLEHRVEKKIYLEENGFNSVVSDLWKIGLLAHNTTFNKYKKNKGKKMCQQSLADSGDKTMNPSHCRDRTCLNLSLS